MSTINVNNSKNISPQLILGGVLFLISFIGINLLPSNGMFSNFVYLISFMVSVFYYLIKGNEIISFYNLFFFFINIYTLAPVINYISFGEPILFQVIPINIYVEYIYLSSIINSLCLIFFVPQKNQDIIKKGLWFSSYNHLLLLLVGVFIFIIQFYFTGAFKLAFSGGNKGQIITKANSFAQVYVYLLSPAIYFFAKKISIKGFRLNLVNILLTIFLAGYAGFWLFIGDRGKVLFLLIVFLFGFQRGNGVKFKKYYVVLVIFFYTVLASVSVSRSWKTNFDILKTANIIIKNPYVLNVGSMEYTWGLMNFAIMRENNFKQSFIFKTYTDQFVDPISKIFNLKYKSVFKDYRDKFHSHRTDEAGDYGGTGFSLFYESIMNFGFVFFWVPIILFIKIIRVIDKRFYKSIKYEFFLILLLPYFMHPGRNGILIMVFITKYLYALIITKIYFLLSYRK